MNEAVFPLADWAGTFRRILAPAGDLIGIANSR
jgi:hypothetical protein